MLVTFNQYGAGSCENMIPKLYRVVKGGREGMGVGGWAVGVLSQYVREVRNCFASKTASESG